MTDETIKATGSPSRSDGGEQDCPVAEHAILNLFRNPESRATLYESLATTRSSCPVHRSEGLGQWVLTRYEDVRRVLRDTEQAVDYAMQMDRRRPDWRSHPSFSLAENLMLSVDGSEHTRLRKVGLTAVNHRLVKRVSPRIRATVERVVAEFARKGGGDFVAEVAFPVTAEVISDIMGLPHEDREWYRHAIAEHVIAFDPSVSEKDLARADAAALAIRHYWESLVRLRREDPQDDILTELLQHTGEAGDGLRDDEVASFCEFLFSAGFETTVHTLSLGMLAFIENPRQWELFRTNLELAPTMVEEVLRYTTTIVGQARLTTRDARVGQANVPAHELLLVSLAGANRDPEVFPDPDTFDITRNENAHVTFGHGRHLCLGAPLARAEVQIVFETIATQLSEINLGPRSAVYEKRLAPRALSLLDLEVKPAQA
jgi:cytochrome P450